VDAARNVITSNTIDAADSFLAKQRGERHRIGCGADRGGIVGGDFAFNFW
jgi:hypothetical protein